jgi:dihydroorotate dehydrogenase
MMYQLFKPFLFLLSPEKAHRITVALLEFALLIPGLGWLLRRLFTLQHPQLERQIMGLTFPNPVGLAAGFDKNGHYLNAMSALGFGFIEVGTVTPIAQEGNPLPRLFRLPADAALINRMGFNNDGLDALVEQLKKPRPTGLIVGGNIGKNKITPNEKAADDYLLCFEKLFPYVDYFVVNVSSPNTPNLRELQDKAPLTALLQALQTRNLARPEPKPILLKIAPDLSTEQLDDILEIVQQTGIVGVIATNTTIDRKGLATATPTVEKIGMGGLSGVPLRARATEVIRYLRNRAQPGMVIIGVGGINSAADAQEKIKAGADLVQVYSGLVYAGPGLVKAINKSFL